MESFIYFVWNSALFMGAIMFLALVIFLGSAFVAGVRSAVSVKGGQMPVNNDNLSGANEGVKKRKRAKEFAPIRKLNENQSNLKIFTS